MNPISLRARNLALADYFQLIADNVSDVVLVAEEDDSYAWVSPSVQHMLGWRPSEMLGRSMRELVHPEDLERVLQRRAQAGADTFSIPELRYRRADGSYLWVSSQVSAVTDDEGRILRRVVVLRDIEAEVAARRRLEASESLYRLLAENASDVVFRSDADHVVQWVSSSVERVLGWAPEQLVGRVGDTLLPGWHAMAARCMETEPGSPVEIPEVEVTCADGSRRWMSITAHLVSDPSGGAGTFIGTLRDVQAEVLERRARTVLEAGNAILVRAEDEAQLLTEMCQAAVDQAGYRFSWYGRGLADAGRTVSVVASSRELSDYLDEVRISWGDDEFGAGPAGVALRSSRAAGVADFEKEAAFRPWLAAATRRGFRSAIALPIRVKDHVDGVLCVYAGEGDAFDERSVALLEELAAQLGYGLGRLRDVAERAEQQRRREESEALLKAIVDGTDAWVYSVDPRTHALLSWNRSFEEYARRMGVSLRVGELPDGPGFKSDRKELWRGYLERALADDGFVTEHTDAPGTTIVRLTVQPLRRNGEVFAVSFFGENITQLKQSELRLAGSVAQLEHATRLLKRAHDLAGLATFRIGGDPPVLSLSAELAQMLGAGLEAGEMPLEHFRARFHHPGDPDAVAALAGESHEHETGLVLETRMIRADGRVIWVRSASTHLREPDGAASIVGVVQDMTDIISTRHELEQTNVLLENAVEETLRAVSNIVEVRDMYTAGHEQRVGELAAVIGAEMGWSKERCRNLRLIGLVHDVGKVAIPAELLSKPAKLTAAEFMVVQSHAELGYEILSHVSFLRPLAEVVRQHHERLDGSGYPLGLVGDQISPEARILAVADVIDAMSSHRPYRPALGPEQALAELEEKKGVLYDPDVVEAAIRVVRRGDTSIFPAAKPA